MVKKEKTRKFIHFGEGVKAVIKSVNDDFEVKAEIVDLSPWALTLFIEDKLLQEELTENLKVKIYLSTLQKYTFHTMAVITKIDKTKKYQILGAECLVDVINYLPENKSMFYTLNDFFALHGWCDDPFFSKKNLFLKLSAFIQWACNY